MRRRGNSTGHRGRRPARGHRWRSRAGRWAAAGRGLLRATGAWSVPDATRAGIGMLLASAVLLTVDGLSTTYTGAALAFNVGLTVLLLGFALLLARHGPRLPPPSFLAIPLASSLMLTGMSFAKGQGDTAALLASTLPILYGAAILRPLGSYTLLAYNVASDAALTFGLLPPREAFRSMAYLLVVVGASSILITRGTTSTRELTALLREQAGVDTLTGLVTRRVLDETAHGALTAGQHTVGTALMLIDVDKFKTINDTLGHPVGDLALKHLAAVLAANTRPDCVIGRLGGDELAVLLPGCEYDVAIRRAEQLVEAVRGSPLELPGGGELPLSVSIGVAHAPTDGADLPGLYEAADGALYEAKRGGRGRSAHAKGVG
ncbi:GGDEF domain-containing protein [Kineosporia succinea]|uniref:Diguanylate cyclase (GGDEF)-like protein n=1 Tax=Kineosporia succinea TaxID=84632 RepID=A0ABT9P5V3_9ACTN|nr:GGDEF domain-containing protein [Kineosporia succinea]MDP9827852.1 diguanylate cyclase (GGDEF)-like protein [Kineosporia succinea]